KTSPSTHAWTFPSPAAEPGVYGKVGSRYSGAASRAGSGATLTVGAPDGVDRSGAADGVAGPLAAGPPNPPPGPPVPRPVTLTAAGTAAAASTTAAAPAPATPTRRRRRISRDRVRTRVSRPVAVGATSARSRNVSRTSMSTSFISSPGGDVPIGDCRAEPRQRARRLNPDVHRRAAEHLGDPVVGKVLVEPQHEHSPLAAGQRGEQRPHLVPGGEGLFAVVGRGAVGHLGDGLLAARRAPPPPRDVLPYEGGAHVELRALGPLDPRPPLVHLREHLLNQVLGAVAVAGEQVGEAEQRRPAVDDELVEAVLHGKSPSLLSDTHRPG